MRLLVMIPAYNEQKYVRRVLARVLNFHPEVLVVDDGSTDGTAAAVEERGDVQLVKHGSNQGYGRSLIDGFNYAAQHGYDWVLTMDCDEQHEPERIPDFIRHIETDRWDVISGSRYLNTRADDDLPPSDRRSINERVTLLINERLGLHLTDSFCGFKAHRVSSMARLQLDVTGYAFPMQFWPQVVSAGLRVTELPVRLIYNDPTRHFGGDLDDADVRYRHYLDVLNSECQRAGFR